MQIMNTALLLFGFFTVTLHAQNFTKITDGDLVTAGGASFGAAWHDYDNDHDLDLFVTNMRGQNNVLFRNDRRSPSGSSIFVKMTSAQVGSLVNDGGDSFACSWGDYDNDGHADLFVANFNQAGFLYHNDGNGGFTRLTTGPIATSVGAAFGSSWMDYNNDGRLDLLVVNGNAGNFLFQNLGGGNFSRVTSGTLVQEIANNHAAAWADYDIDGDVDIFISRNGGQNNALFRNNGAGGFDKITTGDIVNNGGSSLGASWGDYDNDGDPDLFVANAVNENNFLYRNEGAGIFTRVVSGPVVTDGGASFGSSWSDVDNDGDLDLFVANLSQPHFLYLNQGNGSFSKVTNSALLANNNEAHGCTWGDYDRDGDEDEFIANGFNANENDVLFNNDGNNNNWMTLKCLGTISNRSALGAKVRVKAVINGRAVWQMRELAQQTGAYSHNSLEAHFGLGDATRIDSLRVQWPSQRVEIFTALASNRFITITEGGGLTDVSARAVATPENFALLQNYPNPFNPATMIRFRLNFAQHVTLKIFDVHGRELMTLVDAVQAAGEHDLRFAAPARFSSGVYFYRLQTPTEQLTRKMLFVP